MKTRITRIILVVVLSLGLAEWGFAQKPKEVEKQPVRTARTTEVQGEVSAITKNFIAIVYRRDGATEYEMMFPLDKNIKLVHRQSLSEISLGDIVSVEYEEVTEIDREGRETSKRQAQKIYFVKRPAPRPQPLEPEPEPEEVEQIE